MDTSKFLNLILRNYWVNFILNIFFAWLAIIFARPMLSKTYHIIWPGSICGVNLVIGGYLLDHRWCSMICDPKEVCFCLNNEKWIIFVFFYTPWSSKLFPSSSSCQTHLILVFILLFILPLFTLLSSSRILTLFRIWLFNLLSFSFYQILCFLASIPFSLSEICSFNIRLIFHLKRKYIVDKSNSSLKNTNCHSHTHIYRDMCIYIHTDPLHTHIHTPPYT